jgi:MFS family permease
VLFDDEKLKYMGFIQSCIGTGEVVGPFLGSCLYKYFGFFAQFIYLDVFLIVLLYMTVTWLPERNKNVKSLETSNMFSTSEDEFNDEELSSKLYGCKKIVLDFLAFCINITLDNCFIGFFPIVLHTLFHLD